MTPNFLQKIALDDMIAGFNVFLTGDAGTGKSFVIDLFMEWAKQNKKKVAISAPTGIAAVNVSGITVHRLFGFGIGPLVDFDPRKKRLYGSRALFNADILIIDEISFVRIDMFDKIAETLFRINLVRRKQGRKDLQVIIVGDFLQLPPVMTPQDREILEMFYGKELGKGYAFQSKYWDNMGFKTHFLRQQMRQSEDSKDFIKALNLIRFGDARGIKYINLNASMFPSPDAVMICGLNRKVDEVNKAEFDKLKGKKKEYIAKQTGTVNAGDKMVSDVLELKVGCRVMTLINETDDNGDLIYVNGELGTVAELKDNGVKVELDSGIKVYVGVHTWEILGLKETKEDGLEVIGTYSQIPLRLAYAITIHKSQGQTYDKVNLDPYSWDCGQLYTALSRVRSLEGLRLMSYIQYSYLKASPEVISFYRKIGYFNS